ncbi:MAG: hypothetical protein N3H31_05500 [Candidatus Nezhaarchaeota archaeon]|nr:hypothetical protein [Candidatus Nezhaarchaeota archaeon]
MKRRRKLSERERLEWAYREWREGKKSLRQLERELGISRSKLSREFKKMEGGRRPRDKGELYASAFRFIESIVDSEGGAIRESVVLRLIKEFKVTPEVAEDITSWYCRLQGRARAKSCTHASLVEAPHGLVVYCKLRKASRLSPGEEPKLYEAIDEEGCALCAFYERAPIGVSTSSKGP